MKLMGGGYESDWGGLLTGFGPPRTYGDTPQHGTA